MPASMTEAVNSTKALRRTLRSLLAVADVVENCADLEATEKALKDRVTEREAELVDLGVAIEKEKAMRQEAHDTLVRAQQNFLYVEQKVKDATDEATDARLASIHACDDRKAEADAYYETKKAEADEDLQASQDTLAGLKVQHDQLMDGYAQEAAEAQLGIDNLKAEFNSMLGRLT